MNEIRTAFVLGAGLGTRLKTLTARWPKPLIPVCGKPLITFAWDHLIRAGVQELVINTHHCAEGYAELFPDDRYAGKPLHFRHEPILLETGGGIKNVEDLLNGDPFVVYNADILSDLPLEPLIAHHWKQGNEVTLALRSSGGPLHIALDDRGRVIDIANRLGTGAQERFLFTGIYVVNPEFLARIPAETKISVIPTFIEMIQHEAKLGGIVIDDGHWWDLGTREQYLDVHRFFQDKPGAFQARQNSMSWRDPSARIAPDARLFGATAIGAGATIGAGAELDDCVVWDGAEIAPGSVLHRCIITRRRSASGRQSDGDF